MLLFMELTYIVHVCVVTRIQIHIQFMARQMHGEPKNHMEVTIELEKIITLKIYLIKSKRCAK